MSEFELKIKSRDFKTLIETIKINRPDNDLEIINQAYLYAENAHKDQLRLSGEPYITHPLEVGIILANLKMDSASIAAALLHDIVEDTKIPLKKISQFFGGDIAKLVDGVTKISSLKKKNKLHDQAQTLRKMLLATTDDSRVIIIKLADKTHNMRTLMFHPENKQKRIAKEVLEIYAPLAGRLGISKIRSELEDLAFHVLNQEKYNYIKNSVAARNEEIESYIEFIREVLTDKIKKSNINARIYGRVKHFYSIYKKMISRNKTFNEIFDIRAIRIITDHVKDCYGILGIVHTLWSPVPSRFKDYIAVPKSNLYQSLHTTVIGPDNHFLEIQIRTNEMHITAEIGIAAHWAYKEDKKISINQNKKIPLLKNFSKWKENLDNTREFMTELKMDLYEDEIFVFTPQGKIIKLAKGSTPIDFAYAIHTEVGNHCSGATINSKISPLKNKLQTGDIVEIITNSQGHPSESWLKIVKSSNARNKIRGWLRRHQPDQVEKNSLKKKSDKAQTEDKSVSPEVSIPENELLKIERFNKTHKTAVYVAGNSNVSIKLSQCCQPIPGDDVIGFITRGRGITIHKKNCPSLKRLEAEKDRFIEIEWGDSQHIYPVKIAIDATDRPNLLKDIAEKISTLNTNIIKMEAQSAKSGHAIFKFVIEVKSLEHMHEIIKNLKNINNINDVYKLNEKVILK